jgi:hypothetical protein
MQIDFHHGVTYVLARLAGFDETEAGTIAYSAQYVDDATQSGVIKFDNGAMFTRMSSAHKLLDYRNFQELANHRVWLPFHFLPGNGGLPSDQTPPGSFIDKLICRPNSPVAQDMVAECIHQRHKPYALYRLGITLHVYADTWAHQGFAGVNHQVNNVKQIFNAAGEPDRNLLDRMISYFITEALPLGHGAVFGHPDKPFLQWSYINGRGEHIQRNNPVDFMTAAEQMVQALQRYRLGDTKAVVSGLSEGDRTQIAQCFQTISDEKSHVRHEKWLGAIAQGTFSFGPSPVTYNPDGPESWKSIALQDQIDPNDHDAVYPYHEGFLTSHWKNFHDALLAHHFFITRELLPRYGICVA